MKRKINTSNERLRLPEEGFVRLKQVLQFIPVSRSAWYAGIEAGKFPKPIRITDRISMYRVGDIRALIRRLG